MILYADEKPSHRGGIERFCNELLKIYQFNDIIHVNRIGCLFYIFKKKIVNPFKMYKHLRQSSDTSILVIGFSSISVSLVLFISLICKKNIIYAPFFHPFFAHRHPILSFCFFHLITKWLLFNLDAIVLSNVDSKIIFIKYNPNIFCIPLWINNYRKFQISSKKRSGVLFVGRLEKNKGISVLERISVNVNITVVTISDNKLKRKNVVYYQNIDDKTLTELYRSALITIIPSQYESFSFVQLESMLHGTPVMTSQGVKINEYIKNDFVKIVDFMTCDITQEVNNFTKQIIVNDDFENTLINDAEILMEESKGKFLQILQSFECETE